ncbi:hypothetical protein F5878DRAFT_647160, partial [Lentinula raphanica]
MFAHSCRSLSKLLVYALAVVSMLGLISLACASPIQLHSDSNDIGEAPAGPPADVHSSLVPRADPSLILRFVPLQEGTKASAMRTLKFLEQAHIKVAWSEGEEPVE